MLNIFNLFLFLLSLWLMFMLAAGNISWLYLFLGFVSAGLVSLISASLNLVKKDSEILYLSTGFYRHFFLIFVKNFFSSILLIISLSFKKKIHPTLHRIRLKPNVKFNQALLTATFNMSTGLFCVDVKDNEMLIHAINSSYFKKFDLQKTCMNLRDINDDNLI
ncbi:MAG: Na+/H+ antiporter subunit E [Proteobacteria bacterium]|nr:Na+/H+ antiporter subunit E [Pseudomonadota bacterium]